MYANKEKLGKNALIVTISGLSLMAILFIASAVMLANGANFDRPTGGTALVGLIGLLGWMICFAGGVMGLCSLDSYHGKISAWLGIVVFLLFGLAMCAV